MYAAALTELADKYSNVTYLGIVSASEAAQLNADYEWALLPIEDEVTRYAFPSKSSSYVFSDAYIVAICGNHTSVATWVKDNALGVVVSADVENLCEFFHKVEHHEVSGDFLKNERFELKQKLKFDVFISNLEKSVILAEK